MRNQLVARIVIGSLAGVLLAACSSADKSPGRRVDYKKSRTTEALEVPPDLSSSTINDAPSMLDQAGTSFTEFSETTPAIGSARVLPSQESMRVERDGDQQWLVLQGAPQQLWPRVRDFWGQEGFLIKTEDPRVGIIVTEWAENRADIPQGPIRNVIGKVIDQVYSAATRDQYRVRLEKGSTPGTTELFLTHRGVEEVVSGSPEDSTTTWKPRPPDPELEAEMLKRLVVYLGVEQQRAQAMLARQSEPKARAQLITDSAGSLLIVGEDFSRAWRRTGVALDRVGFAVEDRNRSEGVYYVRYSDPLSGQDEKGLLSSLAFWSSGDDKEVKQYQIALIAKGRETHVIVNDAEGIREDSKTATRILTLLEEQLR
ncbi:MAG: outer membrane protein assembly factor BamC [Gammaproteobacteria bacterium]|nr:MAG: outer membrane protein assembly factor BamC [Gammaproteobacteria bacterium]